MACGGVNTDLKSFVSRDESNASRPHCQEHDQELDLYCIDCDQLICTKCLKTDHNGHKIECALYARDRFKDQLSRDETRMMQCTTRLEHTISESTRERQDLMDKKKRIEADICNRHSLIVKAAKSYCDKALASLETAPADREHSLETLLTTSQQNLTDMHELNRQIGQVSTHGAITDLHRMAREMRCGRGSEEAVQKLTTTPLTTICRPVLRFKPLTSTFFQDMSDYIGCSVGMVEMGVAKPEVMIVEQFKCGQHPDTEVYSICLVKDELFLSFEPSHVYGQMPVKKFTEHGDLIMSLAEYTGRVTTAACRNNTPYHLTFYQGQTHSAYAKQSLFRLDNDSHGKSSIKNQNPFENTDEFVIRCGPHRAFDACLNQPFFVVLEEAQTPNDQRKVSLYRRQKRNAIDTYAPPVKRFQPSDVCFYTLGGHEVLLVADELNDAIHVVNVQDGRLSFARYLAPGCPLLVQPTALNTDTRGRLWVACRGGTILACTPIFEPQRSRSSSSLTVANESSVITDDHSEQGANDVTEDEIFSNDL